MMTTRTVTHAKAIKEMIESGQAYDNISGSATGSLLYAYQSLLQETGCPPWMHNTDYQGRVLLLPQPSVLWLQCELIIASQYNGGLYQS